MEDMKALKNELAERKRLDAQKREEKQMIVSKEDKIDMVALMEMNKRQTKIDEQLQFLKDQIIKSDSPFAMTINEDDYQKRM